MRQIFSFQFSFLFFFFFFHLFSYAQRIRLPGDLLTLYNGVYEDMGSDNSSLKLKEKERRLGRAKQAYNEMRNDIPTEEKEFFSNIVGFFRTATKLRGRHTPVRACFYLGSAYCLYYKLVYPDSVLRRSIQQHIKAEYGIDENYFGDLYSSWYCEDFNINKLALCLDKSKADGYAIDQPDCLKKPLPPAPPPPPPTTTISPVKVPLSKRDTMLVTPNQASVYLSDGTVVEGNSPISVLRKMINYGLLNDDNFSITQMVKNDPRLVPFFEKFGTPYELSFNDLRDTMQFPTREYTIPGLPANELYEKYKESMTAFNLAILKVFNIFGGDNFILVTQGRADSPRFSRTPLIAGSDGNMYSNMEITYAQGDTIRISYHKIDQNGYINDDLPNLRGTYLKEMLGYLDIMKEQKKEIFVINGFVTQGVRPKDRQGSMMIYLNYEGAENYYRNNKHKILAQYVKSQ